VKKTLYIFLLFLYWHSVQGQKLNNLFLEGRMHYGFIIAHSPRVAHLITGHTKGLQLNIGKQTVGEKEWNNIYNYPQTGLSLVYFDFANPEQLGSAFGALVFVDLPLIRKNYFTFSLNLGEGLGYVTKKFDLERNRKNTVTGAYLNAAIQIFFQTSYQISKQTSFRLSLGLTHFSNGSLTTPNLGINNVSLSSGIIIYLDSARGLPDKLPLAIPDESIQYEITVNVGPKEIYPPGGKKYFAWALSGEAVKPLSHKFQFGLGADLFYDLSINAREENETSSNTLISNRTRSGIFLSNEFLFNKLTVLLQMGLYLYYPFKDDGRAYHRLGFRYQCTNHLYLNYTLKAHYARADNVEFGLGYKF